MHYSFEFIVPANTPENAPYQERVKLNVGTLISVEVRFRAGCHQRVKFRVRDGLFALIPAAEGPALYGDDVIFHIPMQYKIPSKPYELILEGYSPGTDFSHTLSVWFDVAEDETISRESLADLLTYLQSET